MKKRTIIKKLNKKGSFLGIGELISGIGSLFQSFMQAIPKPVKFLIFLLIIFLLGNLINYIIYFTGTFCNSADQPVRVDVNVFESLNLLNKIPNPEKKDLYGTDLSTTWLTMSVDCAGFFNIANVKLSNGSIKNLTNVYLLSINNCNVCDEKVNIIYYENRGGVFGNEQTVNPFQSLACYGDSYPYNGSNVLKKMSCLFDRTLYGCNIPAGYYWNSQSNTLIPLNNSQISVQLLTIGQEWDMNLQSYNAKLIDEYRCYNLTNTTSRETYACANQDKVFGVVCRDLKPKFALFGIELFRFEYWVMLMLIGILVWIYSHIKK